MGYEQDISTQLLAMQCVFCGKPLRAVVSLERGYGPICDENRMGGVGAEQVGAALRNFDENAVQQIIEDAPDIAPERWIEPTKIAAEGDKLTGPDGEEVIAKGGEIVASRPIHPGSLRAYWEKMGGRADDPRAKWRRDPEVRMKMFSGGIWYASRAVTLGFDGDVVTANKVDPRFLVVASVQQFARAIGMLSAADALAGFYAAKVAAVAKESAYGGAKKERAQIIIEGRLQDSHMPTGWHPEPGMLRVHAPYNEQYNRLARENRDVFLTYMKDGPLFWRYFRDEHLQTVVNILQEAFGSQMATMREPTPAEALGKELVVDTWSGEVRALPPSVARKLLREQPKTRFKNRLRYQLVPMAAGRPKNLM